MGTIADIRPPPHKYKFDLHWPIAKKIVTGDSVGDSYPENKFGANPPTGGDFWANAWNITNFIYLFDLFWERTYRSDRSADFRSWWIKRRRLEQGCATWAFVYITIHLRGQIPPYPDYWSANRRFKPNVRKIQTFIFLKLLHRLQPNFAQW